MKYSGVYSLNFGRPVTIETIDVPEKGRFVIRPFRSEDEAGVLSLWAVSFGSEMSPHVWQWKYRDNPFGHQFMVCESETGIIVTFYGGIQYRAKWRGETVWFTHGVDNMSHPAYRGIIGGRTGLFVRTANAFYEHYTQGGSKAPVMVYGFPGERHFLLGKRVFKYAPLSDGVCFLSASTARLSRGISRYRGRIDQITEIDEALDRLDKKCAPYYPFFVHRDSGFIRWRFVQCPRKYEIWGYRSFFGKGLRCYAVVSFEERKVRIIDLLASPSNWLIGDFISRLASIFLERGLEAMETWLPKDHFVTDAVLAAGFRPQEEPLGIVPTAAFLIPSLSLDWVSRHVYYTMADGDVC